MVFASLIVDRLVVLCTDSQADPGVKVYAGTDPLTDREIRPRKTCKTERAGQLELRKLLKQRLCVHR